MVVGCPVHANKAGEKMVTPGRLGRSAVMAVLVALVLANGGCVGSRDPLEKTPETVAVEEKAGDFLAYYAEVLRLARRYAAEPDSFQTALGALPGSHLTEDEWKAWTEPYREHPERLADHLEEVIANLSTSR
jgi:hypothetical protein